MIGYIYEITGESLQGSYIGSTISLRERKSRHFRELKKGIHYNNILQEYYNKYGAEKMIFRVIKQQNIDNRKSLFELEQEILDEYSSRGLSLNFNKEIIIPENFDLTRFAKRNIHTFEEYAELRILFCFDNYYYHYCSAQGIGTDSALNITQERSYLEFIPKFKKTMANLSDIEKYYIYKSLIIHYLPYITPQQGLSFYQYLQIWAYNYFGISKIDIAKIMGLSPQFLGSNVFGKTKTKVSIRTEGFFNNLTFSDKLDLVKDCSHQLTKNTNSTQSLFFFADIINKQKNGIKIINIASEYQMDRTVISKYINKDKISASLLDKYNSLSNENLDNLLKVIQDNPLLLPLL